MRSLCLSILLVAPLAYAGQGIELRHLAQHTNTSQVRDIALTRSRVWAATGGGLAVHRRSDGRFLFKLTSADGLPGNSLRLVRALDKDRLLVGGDFGAAVLRHANNGKPGAGLEVLTLRNFSRPDIYSPVSTLLERSQVAQDGHILIAFQRGLLELADGPGDHLRIAREIGPREWWRSAATSGRDLALGDLTGRLAIFPLNMLKGQGLWKHKKEVYLDGPILSLAWNRGAFVAATGEGLYLIEKERVRQLYTRNRDGHSFPVAATVISKRSRKRLLVGTADGRIFQLEGDKLILKRSSLGQRVTALKYDRGRLWVGVQHEGLHLASSTTGLRPCRPQGEICGNHVTKLTRHRRWLVAGTFDRGACVLTKKGWKPLDLPSPMVHGLASDGYYLYVANSANLSRFGPRLEPRPVTKREPKMLQWYASEGTTSATRIRQGHVAIASKFGILRIWQNRGRSRVRYTNHLKGAPFKMTDLAANSGKLFVASESEGVKRMDFGQEESWIMQDPRELTENWVTAISPVSAEEIWVATCQQGAIHIKRNRHLQVRRFGTKQGLPDMRLTAITANQNGAFLGTLDGLAWAPANSHQVTTFHLKNGLPDPRSAAIYLSANHLYLGTESGLALFKITGKISGDGG